MNTLHAQSQIQALIDNLKSICANAGLGNDAGEYQIITQIFLYKFLNDKFLHDARSIEPALAQLDSGETYQALVAMSADEYAMLLEDMGVNVRFQPQELIPYLFNLQNELGFYERLDSVFESIATNNLEIFSITTDGGAKISLFEPIIAKTIKDQSKRDNFAKALISSLVDFDFQEIFTCGYDFFAPLFEYLIKDYNKDNGGKYAEYYTPHSVSAIMAAILTGKQEHRSVSCYDPSAGSGTLLMSLAHAIGQDRCTIYAQDISQKSSQLLRLNLILNNLSHSIKNISQGNTLTHPSHLDKKFDFIVSNPPFKLDFSEYRADLAAQGARFFAGVPNITNKPEKMAIYLCFFQHVLNSLSATGRAAIVVPTGFITATSKIERTIRAQLVDSGALLGCITMPPNIFATTGTNVSVVFIDKSTRRDSALLMDASKLGSKTKIEKNERITLSEQEQHYIIDTFLRQESIEDFSTLVPLESIASKSYSFSAGQYFDFKIEHIDLSEQEFCAQLESMRTELTELFSKSRALQSEILENFSKLTFNS